MSFFPYKLLRLSVDDSLLKHLILIGSFDEVAREVSFDDLTGEYIERYLRSLLESTDQIYDPT